MTANAVLDSMERVYSLARARFGAYFRLFPPSPDYQFGKHTMALIRELEAAERAVAAGGCYYGIINMPPRHGKTDVVSRRFPVWATANHPDWDVILTSYSGELTNDLGKAARRAARETNP